MYENATDPEDSLRYGTYQTSPVSPIERLKVVINEKRNEALMEAAFGSRENKLVFQAKVDTYDTCLQLIKDGGE